MVTKATPKADVLGSKELAGAVRRLLVDAGFHVCSANCSAPGHLIDKIIVQVGPVEDAPDADIGTGKRFPLLQIGLCCWLMGMR
jgi:hypothetical protein